MPRTMGATMRRFIVRFGLAAALAIATGVAAMAPASADVAKDRACAQLQKLDDRPTALTTAQKRTLARTIETLASSRSIGVAPIVRQLRTANRRTSNERAAAIREASGWCAGQDAATPAPTPAFPPQHLDGNEPGVFALLFPNNAAAIAHVEVNGGGDLEVATLDANGQRIASIVSTIAPYRGTRPLNFEVGNDPAQLQVVHDGSWSIDILPVDAVLKLSAPATYQSSGDDVLAIGSADRAQFDAPDAGESLRVDAYGRIRVNLINAATPFSGSAILPSDANFVLVIESDSGWSLSLG